MPHNLFLLKWLYIFGYNKKCNVLELCAVISPHKYLDSLYTFVNIHAFSYIHHDRIANLDLGTTT
jgi:hypothetical protein